MNLCLQLLMNDELNKLLEANFIKPVEITVCVAPTVLVKEKNEKSSVCMTTYASRRSH